MTDLGTTATGPLGVDVRGLIEGRLLIQASSGGGKSRTRKGTK